MGSGEWSLVAFTLLSQAAAGMTLLAAVLWLAAAGPSARAGAPRSDGAVPRPFRRVLLVALDAMTAALAVSFLHLGSPGRALLAASRWSSSWLSREVVLAAAFAVLLAGASVLAARPVSRPRAFAPLLVLAAAAGVLLVVAMAGVYMLPAVPPWSGPRTPLAFGVSTALLGAAAVFAVADGGTAGAPGRAAPGWLAWLLPGTVGVALAVKLLSTVLLGSATTAEPVAFPAAAPAAWHGAVAWGAAAAGALAFAVSLRAREAGRGRVVLAWAALAAFVLAEALGRASFYSSYWRIGV